LYFIFSLLVFFIFTVIGLIFPYFFEDKILALIKNLIDQTKDLSTSELIIFITSNNVKVAFFGIVLGILFGILPTLALIINGYVLGFVAYRAILEGGIIVLWRLLPHGIFEIPAILISTAIGIKLGTDLRNLGKNFKSAIRIFIFIILPLLIIAGIIEGMLIGLAS